jgi:acyl-coenzyme A thioesterase PaaI-like protein
MSEYTPSDPTLAERFTNALNVGPSPERAEMRRMGAAMRRVIERLVNSKAPLDELREAADMLEDIAHTMEKHPQGRMYEFAESANAGAPLAFFDHSPVMGVSNPLAPPLKLAVIDDRVRGEVRYGSAYEGPPGAVHGGYVACAFDEVLGLAQTIGGHPGMTGTLTIRYRRPTPLYVDLRFDAGIDKVDGRKTYTSGTLHAGDDLCAEAEGLFIAVDMVKIAELMKRRADRKAGAASD